VPLPPVATSVIVLASHAGCCCNCKVNGCNVVVVLVVLVDVVVVIQSPVSLIQGFFLTRIIELSIKTDSLIAQILIISSANNCFVKIWPDLQQVNV
jgi:hypothetical protein